MRFDRAYRAEPIFYKLYWRLSPGKYTGHPPETTTGGYLADDRGQVDQGVLCILISHLEET